ncbi:MAG TPA: hypothetical protein PKX00_13055 [Opitutaceae bacterium]|nr:hypothetical protein [Opitutaceae bacterium]
MQPDDLVFNPGTVITFAGNYFIDVPVILEIDDIPIIEVVKERELLRTTQFQIYSSDGLPVAKIVGPRIFRTKVGEKCGLTLRHPGHVTVCELEGKQLFEVRRTEAAAISIQAELYASGGQFIKASGSVPLGLFSPVGAQIGGTFWTQNTFRGVQHGFRIRTKPPQKTPPGGPGGV